MNVLQEFNDTDYYPDYGMPWAPWFGFSYIRPLWGYYAPFTFGRWDMYVPAGKYNPVSEYVYGNNLVSRSDYDEKYAWSGRFTGTEYYTTDILGSVMLTTDSLRRVSNRYNYDAYGTNYTGSFSGKNKIGYNSKHYDTGTGWYNYGYRDYNPKLARFTTKDPIRDGSNWFAYCGGDPVNFVDLLGLEARDKKKTVNVKMKFSKSKKTLAVTIEKDGKKRTVRIKLTNNVRTAKERGEPVYYNGYYYFPEDFPNGVWDIINWEYTDDPNQGPTIRTNAGRYVDTYRKKDGKWEKTGKQVYDTGYNFHGGDGNGNITLDNNENYTTWGCGRGKNQDILGVMTYLDDAKETGGTASVVVED